VREAAGALLLHYVNAEFYTTSCKLQLYTTTFGLTKLPPTPA